MRSTPLERVLLPLALTLPTTAQAVKWTDEEPAANDRFGTSVSLDGSLALVGASFATGAESDSGKAYLIDAQPGSPTFGQELIELAASDGASFDSFGTTLALADGLALIGALRDDDGADSAGSAYLFDADPASPTFGQELEKLTASNPAINQMFGVSCALGDGIAVIGSAGCAYLFDADPASATFGQELQILKPSGTGFAFGSACAVGDGIAAVGDPTDDDPGAQVGAVYVYDAVPTSPTFGQEIGKFAPTFSVGGEFFGNAVAIDAGRMLIGAKNSSAFGEANGAAYLFDSDPLSPTFGDELDVWFEPDPFSTDQFGWSVDLDGSRAVIGAPFQYNELFVQTGAAYVFDADLSSPTFGDFQTKLAPAAGGSSDTLGWTVAIAGEFVLAGAPADDDAGMSSGAAWAFGLGDAPLVYCTAKTSSAGCGAAISTSNPFAQPSSGAGDYAVLATGVQEGKNGLIFVSLSGAAALPFNGGTLCMNPPTKRGPVMGSGGDNPLECDGSYTTLVNDGLIVPTGLDAGSGNSAWYQYWYRDPQNGAGQLGTALSNAVQLDFD